MFLSKKTFFIEKFDLQVKRTSPILNSISKASICLNGPLAATRSHQITSTAT